MEADDRSDSDIARAARERRAVSIALNELQALVNEGLSSGTPQPLDMEIYLRQRRGCRGASGN
jgi:hypothetical protein